VKSTFNESSGYEALKQALRQSRQSPQEARALIEGTDAQLVKQAYLDVHGSASAAFKKTAVNTDPDQLKRVILAAIKYAELETQLRRVQLPLNENGASEASPPAPKSHSLSQ